MAPDAVSERAEVHGGGPPCPAEVVTGEGETMRYQIIESDGKFKPIEKMIRISSN